MCQPLRSSLAHLGPASHALVGALYFCDSKLRKKIRPYFMYINILSKEKKKAKNLHSVPGLTLYHSPGIAS